MSDEQLKWVLIREPGPRVILKVTPDGYFIRGEDVTDAEYLEALELYRDTHAGAPRRSE